MLIAESEDEADDNLRRWRKGMESKELRISALNKDLYFTWGGTIINEDALPCTIYRSNVGLNSALCRVCGMWVYRRCSQSWVELHNIGVLEVATCRRRNERERWEQDGLNGKSYECVDEFSYLEDKILLEAMQVLV